MKCILITGANSYVGTNVERWLNREPEKYHVDTIDMIDGSWREKDFAGYDVVFHVAGIAHVKETRRNRDLFFKVNRDLAIEVARPTLPLNILFRGYNLQLSRWFEKKGIRVINSSNAMESCKDKWATYKLVLETHIPQPLTIISKSTHSFSQVVSIVGCPFIAKDRYGMKGQGVYLIDSENMFDSLQSTTGGFSNYLFQEFVSSSYGKDCRIYIAGDTIIGAVLRSNHDDFRANLSQGGTFSDYPISVALREASFKICRVLGAEVVAIDFLFGENGFVFCEANTNAGFHSFNKLGYQPTKNIMDYICNKVILNSNKNEELSVPVTISTGNGE